jgi:hypothetical protein
MTVLQQGYVGVGYYFDAEGNIVGSTTWTDLPASGGCSSQLYGERCVPIVEGSNIRCDARPPAMP